jgi:hypothetical protein
LIVETVSRCLLSLTQALGIVTMSASTKLKIQRIALIVSEAWMIAYVAIMVSVRPHIRVEGGPLLWLCIPAAIFWMFLFFGSPFLITTQRRLALAGWAIAVAVFLGSPFL